MSEETSTPEAAPESSLSSIAKEHFGHTYFGEVQEAPPTPPPEESAAESPAAAEEQITTEGPAEEVQEAQEAPQEAEAPEPEGTPIQTVQELIETSEFDPEWFNSLEVDVKVNGESSRAKLSDVVKSYQLSSAAEKRLDEAKEKAKTQNQVLAQKQQDLENAIQVATGVLQRQKAAIENEEKSVNWAELRANDPAEWSARQTEFAQRKQAVDSEASQILGAVQQQQLKTSQESMQTQQARLQAEANSLLEKLPEWADAEVAEKEKSRVSDYLVSLNYAPEEVAQASDHRMVIMARKAMLYDEMKSSAQPAKKKLMKVPKTLKPGTTKPVDVNHTRLTDAQNAIASNPNSRHAEDAALEILKMRRGN